MHAGAQLPRPRNEPDRYAEVDSTASAGLSQEIERQTREKIEVPILIEGRALSGHETFPLRSPHRHELELGHAQQASDEHVRLAIEAAGRVARDWAHMPWRDRAAIFLKAAELLSESHRAVITAATMLGQSKIAYEAELDAVSELADFWRFNPWFAERIAEGPALVQAPGTWNRATYRPLEGFVLAVTPFNFTSIAGNLPTAPAMMGNVVLWKPASTSLLSSYVIMQVLREAGLPDGVISFLPGPGAAITKFALNHPDLAGLHFTGSTEVFNHMWRTIGEGVGAGRYRSYPRIAGETGGKGFVIAAPDADAEALARALFSGAFGYQGQKCSAASRAYLPRSLWPEVQARLFESIRTARVGDVTDRNTTMGAVIDRKAFNRIRATIEQARQSADTNILIGGESDDARGYFIQPTVVEARDPKTQIMREEIFGPVLSVFIYEDERIAETLELVNSTSPYALTGSIFARDRRMLHSMSTALEQAAGNLYLNDKPTGAVVGQQPFGGSRLSGTNDKAGSPLNLLRWTSLQITAERLRAG